MNADSGTAYFTLPAAAYGGTFAIGDTIVTSFHAAEKSVWFRHYAAAGISAASGNQGHFGVLADV